MGKMRKWEGDREWKEEEAAESGLASQGHSFPWEEHFPTRAQRGKQGSERMLVRPGTPQPYFLSNSNILWQESPLGASHSPPGPLSPSLSTPHAANP